MRRHGVARPEGRMQWWGFGGGAASPLPTSYGIWGAVQVPPVGSVTKPQPKRFLCVFNPISSTTIMGLDLGLTAFDGKNSGEARPIACLRALNAEKARATVLHRLRRL